MITEGFMETIKNFFVGIFVALSVFVILVLSVILWPVVLGIGSLVVFIAVIVLIIVLLFYVIVLIGYVIRKGLKK